MQVESIAAVQQTTAADTQQSSINQDDLFEILLTQLNYQDPLEPMDNQEFIAQLAQFTTLEQSRQQNDKIDELLGVMSTNQAVAMLGKSLEVRLEESVEVGEVIAIAFEEGVPRLSLRTADGTVLNEVSLSQLQVITNP